jgi:hypothetical protein
MRSVTLSLAALASLIAVSAYGDIPEIIACSDQSDPNLRLACYDAAAVKLKADLAAAQSRKLSLFGFTLPFQGGPENAAAAEPEPVLGPKDVTQITARLTDAVKDPYGHAILTLDNGQAWKVMDETLVPLVAARANGVVISKNIMGGFYLSVIGQQNNLSVVRIR